MIDVLNGQRPRLPPDTPVPGPILHLIEACWEEDTDIRPDAQDVLDILDGWTKFSTPGETRGITSRWDWLIEDDKEGEEEKEEEDSDYDFPLLNEDDEQQKSDKLESPALIDSLFDGREFWVPNDRPKDSPKADRKSPTRSRLPPLPKLDVSPNRLGLSIPLTTSRSSHSGSTTSGSGLMSDSGTDSSAWWSDEEGLATPDSSVHSIPVIMSGYDLDTYRFAPEPSPSSGFTQVVDQKLGSDSELREQEKARSEPAMMFKPPKGSVWHNRELQSAWNWYIDRRFLSGKG